MTDILRLFGQVVTAGILLACLYMYLEERKLGRKRQQETDI